MITEAEARAITNEFYAQSPFYADVCNKRNDHRCHLFTINDKLYFEYWAPHEWEFTVATSPADPEYMAYIMLATVMTQYMESIRVTYSRLPSLMAMCKAKASEI